MCSVFVRCPGLFSIGLSGGDREQPRCFFERLLEGRESASMTLIFVLRNRWYFSQLGSTDVWLRLFELFWIANNGCAWYASALTSAYGVKPSFHGEYDILVL